MLCSDGFAQKGQVGVVKDVRREWGANNSVRVYWDNGMTYLHMVKNLKIMDECDPNLAFLIRKEKR